MPTGSTQLVMSRADCLENCAYLGDSQKTLIAAITSWKEMQASSWRPPSFPVYLPVSKSHELKNAERRKEGGNREKNLRFSGFCKMRLRRLHHHAEVAKFVAHALLGRVRAEGNRKKTGVIGNTTDSHGFSYQKSHGFLSRMICMPSEASVGALGQGHPVSKTMFGKMVK